MSAHIFPYDEQRNEITKAAFKKALSMQEITPLEWIDFIYTGTTSQGYAEFRLLPAGKSAFMVWPTLKDHLKEAVKLQGFSGQSVQSEWIFSN